MPDPKPMKPLRRPRQAEVDRLKADIELLRDALQDMVDAYEGYADVEPAALKSAVALDRTAPKA